MISWTYVSRCAVPLDQHEAALRDIVDVARQRNELLKVTGCLVFTGTRFAQYLEGSPISVTDLQKSIIADNRHTEVNTVGEEQLEKRRFSGWSLAYAGPSVWISRTIEETLTEVQKREQCKAQVWVRLMEQFTSDTRH
jgi:Sensors of blue-light using FAD